MEAEMKKSTRQRRWPRNLLIICGAMIVLMIVAWFVLTSAAFFKGVILPQAGKAMNASVTAEDASIKPFKEILLHNLKVQPEGTEPVLLEVKEIRVRYDLMGMLGGNVLVQEILIDSPVVTVVENADGSCNIDPMMQASRQPKPTQPAVTPGEAPQVVLGAFNLTNATLRYIKHHPGGTSDRIDVTGLNVAMNNVQNGQSGSLTFGLTIDADLAPPGAAQRGAIRVVHDGSYDFTLGPDIIPTKIKGSERFQITEARGALNELDGFRADVSVDVIPTEIQQVLLSLTKTGTDLGGLRISGPFDAVKREGKFTVLLSGIDRRALNLAGAFVGIDFGTTTLSSSNTVEIVGGGARLTLDGQLDVASLQLTHTDQTTPVLDLNAAYNLAIDRAAESVTLKTFTLKGAQNRQPILKSELPRPMVISWDGDNANVGDATLAVNLTGLKLTDWRAFAGDQASGEISAALNLLSQQAGQLLSFELDSKLTGFEIDADPIGTLDLAWDAKGSVAEFQQVDVHEFRLEAVESGGPLFALFGSVACDLAKSNLSARVTLSLPPTARAVTNAANLTVNVDMAEPAALSGNTRLAVSTLDLTPLMDRFMGGQATDAAPPAGEEASSAEQEPDPMALPLGKYDVETEIGHLWLREIEVSKLKASANLDGDQVVVPPFEFALNGAPIGGAANLNLGVRGWEYEFSLNAVNVPIAPFADSFVPEYRGAAGGDAQAELQLKGAGITTPNLVQNLTGRTLLSLTNASVKLATTPKTATGRTLRSVLLVVGKALRLPELLSSPIASFQTAATVDAGQVNVSDFDVASESFRIRTRGDVALSPVLTNSTLSGFPVELSLSQSLAQRAKLSEGGTSQAPYVDLGRLASVGGTLGNPKTKLDMTRISLLTARGLANMEGLEGTEAGAVLQGLGGLLGNKGQTNQAGTTTTNTADPSKEEGGSSLIRGVGGLFGDQRNASTNTPPPTNQPPN